MRMRRAQYRNCVAAATLRPTGGAAFVSGARSFGHCSELFNRPT